MLGGGTARRPPALPSLLLAHRPLRPSLLLLLLRRRRCNLMLKDSSLLAKAVTKFEKDLKVLQNSLTVSAGDCLAH